MASGICCPSITSLRSRTRASASVTTRRTAPLGRPADSSSSAHPYSDIPGALPCRPTIPLGNHQQNRVYTIHGISWRIPLLLSYDSLHAPPL